jgi:hypothetical protein
VVRSSAGAVWSPSAVDINGQSTGGHAEQAYKHRARDAGRNRQILRRLSPVCLTQLHTGPRGLRPRRSARPRISCGGNQRHSSGAFRVARTRSADFFFSYRAGASVARIERSAIRVIVSGAGKSRISLRFMRATDSCAGVFLLPWREKVASPLPPIGAKIVGSLFDSDVFVWAARGGAGGAPSCMCAGKRSWAAGQSLGATRR